MSANGSGGKLSRKDVERCVKVWTERLGLKAWDIVVDWTKPPREESNATTWRMNTYDRAEMYFDPGFVGWTRTFLNQTVVHELLHLITRDVDRVVAATEGHMHSEAFKAIDSRYEHEIEGVVDRLSVRIVQLGGLV